MTILAIDIGLNAAAISSADVFDIVSSPDDFNTKLMTRNSWVAKKRHFSEVPTVVGAADANCFNTHKGLTRLQCTRLCNVNHCPLFWLYELERFHY